MDWEMIAVFSALSVGGGAFIGFLYRSFLQGLFFTLCILGLVPTAALVQLTRYDGVIVWIAGPLITLTPFYVVLKLKFPNKWAQLQKGLKSWPGAGGVSMEAKDEKIKEADLALEVKRDLNTTEKKPTSVALKWALWPAGFGMLVGISSAMKGSAPLVGKIILGTILGGLLALILGGTTFVIVFLVVKIRG